MNWQRMTELEPELSRLAADVESGRQTLGDIMLHNALAGLVGKHAVHPRLRLPGCYAVAYVHLSALDKARRGRCKVQA